MIDAKILREKAQGYIVCFHKECPLHEHCLHWQAGCYVPERMFSVNCFNPRHSHAGSNSCPGYRSDQPQRIARGMVGFYSEMPRAKEVAIKKRLIEYYTRVNYYRYRRGEYPITTTVEQKITEVCRECGWTAPLVFDSYSEELVW